LDIAAAHVYVAVLEGQCEITQGQKIGLRVASLFGLLDARLDRTISNILSNASVYESAEKSWELAF
jgi:hypothetical protein